MTIKEFKIQDALGLISYQIEVELSYQTEKGLLRVLSGSKYKRIRQTIAFNRNTPIVTLIKLANDVDENIRAIVSLNPNTPTNIIKKLSIDKDSIVKGFASNVLLERNMRE